MASLNWNIGFPTQGTGNGYGVGGYNGRAQQPQPVDAENLTATENPSIGSEALASLGLNIDQLKVGGSGNPYSGGVSGAGGQYGVAATQNSKTTIPGQTVAYGAENQSLAQNLVGGNIPKYQSPKIDGNGINNNWMKDYYC